MHCNIMKCRIKVYIGSSKRQKSQVNNNNKNNNTNNIFLYPKTQKKKKRVMLGIPTVECQLESQLMWHLSIGW